VLRSWVFRAAIVIDEGQTDADTFNRLLCIPVFDFVVAAQWSVTHRWQDRQAT
jgi:hypothetical protein